MVSKAKPELAFQPQFLNADQAALVSEVAEIIIPKTDTPGAKMPACLLSSIYS
ncbi:MAG: gluconate 2-dehydrogenase subunit 3 family protein [Bacteroidota bacterium]